MCATTHYLPCLATQVLLLMDNASSHMLRNAEEVELHGFKALKLSNVTILFLPANTTSWVQPMDAGIIACFKALYRKLHLAW